MVVFLSLFGEHFHLVDLLAGAVVEGEGEVFGIGIKEHAAHGFFALCPYFFNHVFVVCPFSGALSAFIVGRGGLHIHRAGGAVGFFALIEGIGAHVDMVVAG